MPSRHKFLLVKVEAEQDHILEEEEEAHIEVEESTLQSQVEGATIKMQVKAQAKIKHKVRDDPIHFEDVVKEEKWVAEMEEAIEAIEKNDTWIDAYLLENGFNKCDGEPTLYIKESDGKILIVVLYVDDLILMGSDDFLVADFKEFMESEFGMTELASLRSFFGIEVKQTENGIFISQAKYVADILERFKMHNNKPAPTPTIMGFKLSKEDCSNNVNLTLYKSMIGNLMYLITTSPDMMYVVSLVLRFMETSKETHWQVEKRILRYVNGTKQYGILYTAIDETS
eukprot:PITA_30278